MNDAISASLDDLHLDKTPIKVLSVGYQINKIWKSPTQEMIDTDKSLDVLIPSYGQEQIDISGKISRKSSEQFDIKGHFSQYGYNVVNSCYYSTNEEEVCRVTISLTRIVKD